MIFPLKIVLNSLFSQKLMNIYQIGGFIDLLFKYAANFNIPEDVYHAIQAFFNYFFSIPDSGLNEFWTSPYTENSKLYQHITTVLGNLLDKLWNNRNMFTDVAKRTNTILAKLCLIIYVHPKYQFMLNSISNGKRMRLDNFRKMLDAILQLCENRAAYFDLTDDDLIEKIHGFLNYRTNLNGIDQEILQILSYVITVV